VKDLNQAISVGRDAIKRFFSAGMNCCETCLMAAGEALALDIDKRMLSALGGGFSERSKITNGNCGLVTGSSMALGLAYMRKRKTEEDGAFSLEDRIEITRLGNIWFEKFLGRAGSISCPAIVGSLPYMGDEHRRKCWNLGKDTIELFLGFLAQNDLIS